MRPNNPFKLAIMVMFAAVGMTGCATTQIVSPAQAVVGSKSKNWFYAGATKDEPAKLAFGEPNSDDVDLMVWCAAARHEVQFTPVGSDDESFKRMTITSGGQTLDLSLRQDKRLGPVAAVQLDAPLLAAFRLDGRLRMALDGQRPMDLNAKPPEGPKQVQSFFRVCK